LGFSTTKLSDLIAEDCILDLNATTKGEAIASLSRRLAETGRVQDGEAFRRALMAREEQASTGVGLGIAIPHVKIPEIADCVVAVGRSREGIPFDAVDGKPVHLIFAIGASDRQTREFVKLLAQMTHLLKDDRVRAALMDARVPDQFLSIIRENER
jgi:PTS system fructose-specific IIC component